VKGNQIHNSRREGKTNPGRLPKVIGCDSEMGNFIRGVNLQGGTGQEASRKLIREIPSSSRRSNEFFLNCSCHECERHREKSQRRNSYGYGRSVPLNSWAGYANAVLAEAIADESGYDPRDHERRYLAENGGCVYIDLDHVELCLPETRSVFDHVACWHAGLRILRGALDAANRKLPDGQKIHVLVNNSDGQGHSYGSHLNFLVTRRCWRNIFERKMQYLLSLAAFQVSSIVCTGQGKVGSENRAPDVDYQLSQRADFIEQIAGPQTTYARPIVNSRDEPHCKDGMARLHVIFFDNTLCEVASLLKAGVMQIILAMIEAEHIDHRLALDDPVRALKTWSHDPGLRAVARMSSGPQVTAVELQSRFLEDAARFVNRGHCDGIVPEAGKIVELWADTLAKLERRDFPALSRRLDWVLKMSVLEGVIEERRDLDWQHPAVKKLDHVYSSLDLSEGLYWAYEAGGHVERVVGEADVERFAANPPADTRAWARAMLLRRAGADRVADINWDQIRFIVGDDDFSYHHRTIDLEDPLESGYQEWNEDLDGAATLDIVLDAIDRCACGSKKRRSPNTTNQC
jgi:proteasome accessory factor A